MLKLKRNCLPEAKIPDASMADIAFLLIIFFMVTRSFHQTDSLPVSLPQTQDWTRVQLPTRGAIGVSIAASGEMRVENLKVSLLDVQNVAEAALAKDPERFFIVRADQHVAFKVVDSVLERLRLAGARNLAFETRSGGGGFGQAAVP